MSRDDPNQSIDEKGGPRDCARQDQHAGIRGRRQQSYIDWIAPTFLVTLVSLPAGSVPAG
jgi:hypothetical protein